MSIRGWPTSEKLVTVEAQHATVEPTGINQYGLSVQSKGFSYQVASDAVEASSTTTVINATAHVAVKGDVIRFSSGALSGFETKVIATTANTITVADTLSVAPSAADVFLILRPRTAIVDSNGNLAISSTQSPVQFVYNAVDTEVEESTTPANSRPLPVKVLDGSGNEVGFATQTTLASVLTSVQLIDDTVATTGSAITTKGMAAVGTDGTNARVLKTDASGELQIDVLTSALPSGASTSANQTTANSLLTTIDADTSALAGTVAGTEVQVDVVAALPAGTNNIGDVDVATLPVSFNAGNSDATTQRVVIATDQAALTAKQGGKTCVARARIDYSTTSVTTAAYVQLIASVGGTAVTEVEIFDSSGQTLFLATGAAASEADQVYIFPGGNGRIPLAIAASTRVSVKAVSATANVGELTVNFYA